MKTYLIKLGDALSQFFNVLLFNGDPNYSISGDAYRFKRTKLMKVIDTLFKPLEKVHCRMAYEKDVSKAHKLILEAYARSGEVAVMEPAPVQDVQKAATSETATHAKPKRTRRTRVQEEAND